MTVESSRSISLYGRGCALVLILLSIIHDIDSGGLCLARTWQGIIYVVFIPL